MSIAATTHSWEMVFSRIKPVVIEGETYFPAVPVYMECGGMNSREAVIKAAGTLNPDTPFVYGKDFIILRELEIERLGNAGALKNLAGKEVNVKSSSMPVHVLYTKTGFLIAVLTEYRCRKNTDIVPFAVQCMLDNLVELSDAALRMDINLPF